MQAGDSEDFKSLNASYSIWIYGFSFCRCLNTYSTGYLYEIPPTSADNLSWLPGRILVSQNCFLEKNKSIKPAQRKKDVLTQYNRNYKA